MSSAVSTELYSDLPSRWPVRPLIQWQKNPCSLATTSLSAFKVL